MGDRYYMGLWLICMLILVASGHVSFLATANRYDQREPPGQHRPWKWIKWMDPPELFNEKGKRYRRRFIAMQLAAGVLWVVGLLVGAILGI